MVTITRPVRVPKNLRWVLIFATLTIIAQVIVIAVPSAISTATNRTAVVASTPAGLKQHVQSDSTNKVKPGQTINLTFITTNTGNQPQTYIPQVSVEDLRDYATIQPDDNLKLDDHTASWPIVALDSGQSTSTTLTIHIMSVVNNRAADKQHPDAFDGKLQVIYGNTLSLALPMTFTRSVEQSVVQLPQLPTYCALIINMAVLTSLLVLIIAAKQREFILSRTLTNSLLGWFIGGLIVLMATWLVSLQTGLVLTGAEALAGGLAGLVISLPITLTERKII